jgi:hypothetical protein
VEAKKSCKQIFAVDAEISKEKKTSMVLYISNIKLSHSCAGQVNHFLRTSAENLSTDQAH